MAGKQAVNQLYTADLQETTIVLYGARFVCRSDSVEIISRLCFDFAGFDVRHFSPLAGKTVQIDCLTGASAPQIPPVTEKFRTSTFVCYDHEGIRYTDYFGKALLTYNYRSEQCAIYSSSVDFAYEKFYLTILSRAGLFLDLKGLHRIHALGICWLDQASLFVIPQNGGKTTLALDLLFADPELKILSEDTPLLSADGICHSFPFRLGTRDSHHLEKIEPSLLARGDSRNGQTKTLIHPSVFASRFQASPVPVGHVYLCRWTTANQPELTRAGLVTAFWWLFRDCVVGLGVPQVAEIFLRMTLTDLFQKSWIAARRLFTALRVLCSSNCRMLSLCPDRKQNLALVIATVKKPRP